MNTRTLAEQIERLDFEKALRRVKYDSRYDFIQFPVELTVFEEFADDNLQQIIDTIKQEQYVVEGLRRIWVPKRNFFLRPGSIPHIDDRVLFQALVDNIAELLEQQLIPLNEEVVFSSRLNEDPNSARFFRHPKDLWLAFKNKAIKFCKEEDINFVLISDIASYFENIDLRLLTDTVSAAGVSPVISDSIRQILLRWANGRTRGLPQMLAPCSLLANTYLSQVDNAMLLRGYRYIRYVDDIRIFVRSETELKKALYDLTEQLRLCYLDVQASKTRFDSAEKHVQDLTILERHLTEVGIAFDGLEDSEYSDSSFGRNRIPEDKLIEFLSNLLDNSNYDDRHLRFCINHLGYIGSNAGVDLALSKLESHPQETDTFVQYMLRLSPEQVGDEVIHRIVDFLDSKHNLYAWQAMWLLILLCRLPINNVRILEKIFRNEFIQRHDITRALTYYLLGKHGNFRFRREIMSRYSSESSLEARMAILCGTYELDKQERNRFYSMGGGHRQLTQLISILKNKEVKFA